MQPIKRKLVVFLKQRAFYRQVADENEKLKNTIVKNGDDYRPILEYFWFAEPGHYYSPLVDVKGKSFDHLLDIKSATSNQKEIALPGIDINKKAQQVLFAVIAKNAGQIPDYEKPKNLRYKYDNDQFGRMDAGVLFLMLRHFKPRQIIEVGSGWSSALMLDVNQIFPKNAANLTFIEPYPERLYSTLKPGDKKHCSIVTKFVQEVDTAQFQKLGKDDVLFIDNSHVSKYGSDVNYLFLKILPQLKKGVLIHIHDIFYPFEYPKDWVFMGRNWNEDYFLKAFLMYNNDFEIILFSDYLHKHHKEIFKEMPLCYKNSGGNLWIRKK